MGGDKSGFVEVDNIEWFNVFGLIFLIVIIIPNIVFAIKCKDGFNNKWNNKYVECLEQVGRFGCFGFMRRDLSRVFSSRKYNFKIII